MYNERNLVIVRILIAVIISFLLFLIFSVNDGLFAFIILLNFIAFIDLIQLLISRKFRILIAMMIFYIILIGFYYKLIDSGILR